ncbi:DUF2306 domain-containing protein [Microlunatus ginsengisoli]|uniref:DUF2306 domain-containing protein n=1 Tax=Microlunatus ginsengisoli TaxID=363863 RepID=A0ABP6ZDY3_9ACTN
MNSRHPSGGGSSRSWPVPVVLVALAVVPLTAGSLRLLQLAGGPALMPADDRFTGVPVVALVVHIAGAAVFALLGALQFPRLRTGRGWHRRAGRIVAGAGLAVAGSALMLTLLAEPQPGTGDLLYVLRLVFGSAMAGCVVLGLSAIRRRDVAAHRAWMIRGYAIGLAAGTQVFTEGISDAVFGTGELRSDLAKGAGWVINLLIAEWVLRRHRSSAGRRPGADRQPAAAGARP